MLTQERWEETYGRLRSYQKDAVAFMLEKPKTLEFDDMGLGKTVTTMTAALHRAIDKATFRLLVLCPTNALYVWQEEFRKWFDLETIMYTGTIAQRKKLRINEVTPAKFRVVITTYGMLKEMKEYYWDVIIADEIHQAGLLRHTNQTYKNFAAVAAKTPIVYQLTGTPIRQGVIDLYAPLHIVDGETFSSYWGYVNRHCIVTVTPFGKEIERNPKNIPLFRDMLNRHMIRRLKSEVLKDLPGKQRNVIPLQMTPKQAAAHQGVMEDLYFADADTLIATPNKMTAVLRARQLLVTPRLLGIDDDGAALNYIREVGADLMVAGRPFVVFTPFRQALPIVAEIIKEIDPAITIFEVHGGMTPAAFANSWQGFQKHTSKKKVMLCVIKSGASFHATEAADCFFLGYEWDFNLNSQSEDRLCRIGQSNFVNCNYLLHRDTVDEIVKEKLNDKNAASNWIVGTDEQYQMMLRYVQPKKPKSH